MLGRARPDSVTLARLPISAACFDLHIDCKDKYRITDCRQSRADLNAISASVFLAIADYALRKVTSASASVQR